LFKLNKNTIEANPYSLYHYFTGGPLAVVLFLFIPKLAAVSTTLRKGRSIQKNHFFDFLS